MARWWGWWIVVGLVMGAGLVACSVSRAPSAAPTARSSSAAAPPVIEPVVGRHALVVANHAYPKEPGALRNPPNDAAALTAALTGAGFAVTEAANLDRRGLLRAVDGLVAALKPHGEAGVGFVYYSGHGASTEASGERRNYWMPTDVPIASGEDLENEGVALTAVLDKLSKLEAKAVFVVSDACRNTLPWSEDKSGASKGFGAVPRRAGLFLAFATADGQTTPDDGRFATALAAELGAAGQTADRAFTKALRVVRAQRGRGQGLPFVADGLTADVCFHSCPPSGRAATAYSAGEEAYNAGRNVEARGHYEASCSSGEFRGCANLGWLYLWGKGGQVDLGCPRLYGSRFIVREGEGGACGFEAGPNAVRAGL